jgi:hypothetical protein
MKKYAQLSERYRLFITVSVTSDSMTNGRKHVSYYTNQVIYGEVLQNPAVAWLVKKSLL